MKRVLRGSLMIVFASLVIGLAASRARADRAQNASTISVPEPATMILFGTGLAGAAAIFRKRLKSRGQKSK